GGGGGGSENAGGASACGRGGGASATLVAGGGGRTSGAGWAAGGSDDTPPGARSSCRNIPICSYSARTCRSRTAIRCSSAIAPPRVQLLERVRRRAAARRELPDARYLMMVTTDVAVCVTGITMPAAFTVSVIVCDDVDPR